MSRAVLAVFVVTFLACGPVPPPPDGSGGGLSIGPNTGGGPNGGGGGPAGGGPSNGGGPSGTGGGSSSGGQCCINDAFYACGSTAAFQQCIGFDVNACIAACAPMDFSCPQGCFMRASMSRPDPSACTRDMNRDGECGSSNTCNTQRGSACTLDSQCSSRNCTEGYCRANSAGARCTLDSHCESRNCTDGCCRNTSTSSACTLDSQCTTRNCTNGRCSGNGRGSACTLDSHCTSRNCTNGRCQ